MRAVMNLYEGAKTRVRVGPEWFEEFEVNEIGRASCRERV